MHLSQKGHPWCFGMKAHIGADAHLGRVHTVRRTSGHARDVTAGSSLLTGAQTPKKDVTCFVEVRHRK
jgi:IS5 family transposase